MRRSLILFLKVAAVVTIAVWLANRPGQVEFVWQGQVFETSIGVLVLLVGLLMAGAAFGYRFWRGMVRAPGTIGRARLGSRREGGYRALTNGMVAVAAGDPTAARRYAKKADALLDEPPLTMLLSAQAAQLSGDETAAGRYFEAMLEREETEFLGLRGLLNQALKQDDRVKALSFVDLARKLRPNTPWVLATAFELEVRQRKWREAQASLAAAVKAGAIEAGEGRRHKAAILIERSREAEAAGDMPTALELAHKATSLLPGFAPAINREAALLARADRLKQAARLIEKAWEQAPHLTLAQAYLDLAPREGGALERVKWIEKLHRLKPEAAEVLAVLGEAALAAQLWGAARTHLTRAEQVSPSRRIYRLLAELEAKEHEDMVAARNWLAKAEEAPDDPAWLCDRCGTAHPVWTALCRHCGAFDVLTWRTPTAAAHLPAPDARALAVIDRSSEGPR
ncbi:MAG: heme biosynthesis protein HemY [Inquilinus sp.]|nr:heme biosynthesis protein HemY [Inquilinus sp.]